MEVSKLNTSWNLTRQDYFLHLCKKKKKKSRVISNFMLINMKREAKYMIFKAIICRNCYSTITKPKTLYNNHQQIFMCWNILALICALWRPHIITQLMLKNSQGKSLQWQLKLTTGSVGWKIFSKRLQIVLGRIWSWLPLFPGRMPRNAKNTANGDPIQKKFST